MIESFADADTEAVFQEQKPSRKCKLPPELYSKTLTKLRLIDMARVVTDLYAPPSNRLEALSGNRKGQYSIRINERWRICFTFAEGMANQVQITDHYH